MIRLPQERWHQLEPITDHEPFVTVSMMVQRHFPGEIWVDSPSAPSVIIGLLLKDFFAWGDLSHPGAAALLARAKGSAAAVSGLDRAVQQVWPEGFERLPHVGYRFAGPAPLPPLPSGFRLERMGQVNKALVHAIWPSYAARDTVGDFQSYEDFILHGYGYIAVEEVSGRCVSACAAISVSRERADHGLDTLPGYEGRGLATAVAHATVMEGVRRGLRPVWWTEVSNLASRRVAEKVGMVLDQELDILVRN